MINTTIRPSDINLRQSWGYEQFPEAPEQTAARQVVEYLQEHGNTWSPFDYDHFDQWLTDHGDPSREGIPRLGWLTDDADGNPILATAGSMIVPTSEFVSRCFRAAGKLPKLPKRSEGSTLYGVIDQAIHRFTLVTAMTLVEKLALAGCEGGAVDPPSERGRVRLDMFDTDGRPFKATVYIINANPADGELVPLLKASFNWFPIFDVQIPILDDVTPDDAANAILDAVRERHPRPARSLGITETS